MGAGIEERRAAVRDDMAATLEETNPSSQTLAIAQLTGADPSELLIKTAAESQARFVNPAGPKSELASARRLIQTYELLHSLAILARRARDGALLKERQVPLVAAFSGSAGPPAPQWEPWLSSRPKSVEEIPPFTPGNIRLWRNVIADAENRGLGDRRGVHPLQRKPLPEKAEQLFLVTKQKGRPPLFPFLLYFGNYGKLITVVKDPKMSLKTESGRIALVSYILRVVGDHSNGVFTDHTGAGKDGDATAEQLARAMLNSSVVGESGGIARVLFAANMNEVNLIDLLKPGQTMQMVIDQSALKVIETFTKVKKEFTVPAPAAGKTGCAAIEWMKEILAEVPLEYKILWMMRKIEEDRGVYESNLVPGQSVPMEVLLPVSSESNGREVVFLGGGMTAGELLVMTQEGRILALNARMRNLQSFCTAVLSVAPWVAWFYLVAATAGIIVAGQLLPAVVGEILAGGSRLVSAPGMLTGALRTTAIPRLVQWTDALVTARRWEAIVGGAVGAASIAFDVRSAGGVQAYIKKLKNPWEAAFLLLNLLSIKGAFKADDLAKMIEESRVLGQAALRLQQEEKALAGATALAERETAAATRALGQPRLQPGPTQADEARAVAPTPTQSPVGGRQIESRLGPAEPVQGRILGGGKPAANANIQPPKEPVVLDDIARMRQKKAEQARQQVVVDTAQRKAVGDLEGGPVTGVIRAGPAQGSGQGQTGSVVSGVTPTTERLVSIRGSLVPIAPIPVTRTEQIRREALRKVKEGLAQLAGVTVALGQRVAGKFESLSGAEAVRRLFANRLSDFPRLAQHWPRQDARAYVAEIQRLILDRLKGNRKLAQEFAIAFQPNRADPEAVGRLTAELLNKLPLAVRREIKKTVAARWNTIRETFWKNVYDDPGLVDELGKLGITFPGRGRAPVLRVGEKDLQITLDHISRKVENPLEAFNPANLRPLTPRDNSSLKESLVKDIKEMTGLSLDEFNRLSPPQGLTKELADELGKVLDEMSLEDDLFRGLGWESL